MVEGHEDDVDDDAERDEQLGEGIEHQVGPYLADLKPDVAAVPDAKHVDRLLEVLAEDLFVLGTLVVVVVDVAADMRQLAHGSLRHLVDDVVQVLDILEGHGGVRVTDQGTIISEPVELPQIKVPDLFIIISISASTTLIKGR